MTAWKRWQDWATVLLGVVLFITPFVFGTTSEVGSAWTAYAIGALLALGGVWSASTDEPNAAIEWVPLILGVALFVAPWAIGYATAPVMAWMSWIIAGLVVLNAGGEILFVSQKPSAA